MIRLLAYASAAIAALAAFLWSKKAQGAEMQTDSETPSLRDLFEQVGARRGVDPKLLEAIGMQESGLNPDAVRNNPPRDISVGLMQVLCIPDANGNCSNRLNVDGWADMTFDRLKDPETNIDIAAQILAWNIATYGYPRGIAVYNNWGARIAPLNGPFPNQNYVDRVLRNLARLQT